MTPTQTTALLVDTGSPTPTLLPSSKSTVAVTITTSVAPTSSGVASSSSTPPPAASHGISTGAKVAAILVPIVIIAAVVPILVFWYLNRRAKRRTRRETFGRHTPETRALHSAKNSGSFPLQGPLTHTRQISDPYPQSLNPYPPSQPSVQSPGPLPPPPQPQERLIETYPSPFIDIEEIGVARTTSMVEPNRRSTETLLTLTPAPRFPVNTGPAPLSIAESLPELPLPPLPPPPYDPQSTSLRPPSSYGRVHTRSRSESLRSRNGEIASTHESTNDTRYPFLDDHSDSVSESSSTHRPSGERGRAHDAVSEISYSDRVNVGNALTRDNVSEVSFDDRSDAGRRNVRDTTVSELTSYDRRSRPGVRDSDQLSMVSALSRDPDQEGDHDPFRDSYYVR